jgi:HSP20 family protein
MSALTLSRRGLFPKMTSDFFEPGSFMAPRILGRDGDFLDWDFTGFMPAVNIMETSKEFRIEMAVPGMQKKDFKIKVENFMLTISTEKKEETKEAFEHYTFREFSFHSFSRSFRLPENCFWDKIDARYDNGILFLAIPKKEVATTKLSQEIKVL